MRWRCMKVIWTQIKDNLAVGSKVAQTNTKGSTEAWHYCPVLWESTFDKKTNGTLRGQFFFFFAKQILTQDGRYHVFSSNLLIKNADVLPCTPFSPFIRNYLSIRCNIRSLAMDKWFNPTLCWACDHTTLMGLKLNHIGMWNYRTGLFRWTALYFFLLNYPSMFVVILNWPDYFVDNVCLDPY